MYNEIVKCIKHAKFRPVAKGSLEVLETQVQKVHKLFWFLSFLLPLYSISLKKQNSGCWFVCFVGFKILNLLFRALPFLALSLSVYIVGIYAS